LTQPKADLLQGTLDMLILKALSLGPLHGYGIIQRLRQLSDELLEVEQGSLYPAVYRIEQRGWISSRWGCDRDRPPGQVLHTDESRE
jgi:PadR family transcriptional regulator PadR